MIEDVAEWEEWRALELQAQNTPQLWEQVGEDSCMFLQSLRSDLMPFLMHLSLQALQNFCKSRGMYGSLSYWCQWPWSHQSMQNVTFINTRYMSRAGYKVAWMIKGEGKRGKVMDSIRSANKNYHSNRLTFVVKKNTWLRFKFLIETIQRLSICIYYHSSITPSIIFIRIN